MNKVMEVVKALGGVAYTRQLRANGCTVRDIKQAVAGGGLRHLRKGVYVHSRLRSSIRAAVAHGGALTCMSSLRLDGVWVMDDQDVHVHVWMGPSGRKHPHSECRCKAHYGPGDLVLGRVAVRMALVHLYVCQGDESFLCSYESAWNKGLLSAADREWIRQQLPPRAYWLLDFAVPTADSGLETLARFRLRIHGFSVVTQFVALGDRTDLLIEGLLLVETDGNDNHSGPSKRHKDLAKDARSSVRGYETLRFDYRQVVYDWMMVEAAVLAAVRRIKGRI